VIEMNRRQFLLFLAAATGVPLDATAEGRVPLIGLLDPGVPQRFDAFMAGMRDLGYVEGANVAYARVSALGNYDAVPALAAYLVELKVDLIVTVGTSVVREVQRAAPSVPIVFIAAGDPLSVIESIAHPGRHTTGLTFVDTELSTKRLDLLRKMVPNLRQVALVFFAGAPRPSSFERTEITARALGVQVHGRSVGDLISLEAAFQDAARTRLDAVDFLGNPYFNANREFIAQIAAKYRLPAIYDDVGFVRVGGLMAYGPVFAEMARRGATLVDKVLKGVDPGDIPVEVTTKFVLSINAKAAAALGLEVPPDLLAAADEVIE
jgi:putative tryptophan/tyrosine transport system substrate-binding protein